MKRLRRLAMVLALVPLSACAGMKTLELRDVGGLRGGQVLFLRADGSGICQRLERGGPPAHAMRERRHVLALDANAVHELDQLLAQRHFAALAIEPRAALPGAVRRSITVRFADDSIHRVAMWAGDGNEDFQAIYLACMKILAGCMAAPPAYQGPYDESWLPPGF